MPKKIDLTGKRFGRLLVVREVPRPQGYVNTRARWFCVCDCGNTCEADSGNLRYGCHTSCGCFKSEIVSLAHYKHGNTVPALTPEYQSWKGMLNRCFNPNGQDYADYGGRGITICERWLDFKNFLSDMGDRPEGKEIDRYPDNNGNYEPGNCRWATRKEQTNNTRANRKIEWRGSTYTVAQLSEFLNIPYHWFYERAIKKGLPIERIIALRERYERL